MPRNKDMMGKVFDSVRSMGWKKVWAFIGLRSSTVVMGILLMALVFFYPQAGWNYVDGKGTFLTSTSTAPPETVTETVPATPESSTPPAYTQPPESSYTPSETGSVTPTSVTPSSVSPESGDGYSGSGTNSWTGTRTGSQYPYQNQYPSQEQGWNNQWYPPETATPTGTSAPSQGQSTQSQNTSTPAEGVAPSQTSQSQDIPRY